MRSGLHAFQLATKTPHQAPKRLFCTAAVSIALLGQNLSFTARHQGSGNSYLCSLDQATAPTFYTEAQRSMTGVRSSPGCRQNERAPNSCGKKKHSNIPLHDSSFIDSPASDLEFFLDHFVYFVYSSTPLMACGCRPLPKITPC